MTSYIARPRQPNGAGILMLHAWWGFNDFFKAFCDRIAENGFTVVAPDLFQGKVAKTIPEAEALAPTMERQIDKQEILDAVTLLQSQEGVTADSIGVIGISFGAYYALWLSNQPTASTGATVIFYGTGHDDFTRSTSAFLGHFAENDPFEPPENVQELEQMLRSASREVEFYTYPGLGHWFFEDDRPDAYDENAANLAWERTLAFLQKHLVR